MGLAIGALVVAGEPVGAALFLMAVHRPDHRERLGHRLGLAVGLDPSHVDTLAFPQIEKTNQVGLMRRDHAQRAPSGTRLGVTFITLRRRSPKILAEIRDLPASAWRRIRLDVPARKYRTPRVWEKNVQLAACRLRQLYILDLGHDQPTVLVTNDTRTPKTLITR